MSSSTVHSVLIARFSTEVNAMSNAKPFVAQQHRGALRFLEARDGQADVGPSGEAVFPVPEGFAVAQQDDLVHGSISD